jgi:hypothetical protein
VCLPDFQGVGIGNKLSEFVAGVMRATGKPYRSTTGNPAMIRYRAKSPMWKMLRNVCLNNRRACRTSNRALMRTAAATRFTAGFEYVGPIRAEEARRFAIV